MLINQEITKCDSDILLQCFAMSLLLCSATFFARETKIVTVVDQAWLGVCESV